MMPAKNCVGQIIEMKAATLTLISLTMRLGFILTPLNHFLTVTLGAAYPLSPSHLTHSLVAFSIVNQVRKVQHFRSELTLFQLS